MPGTSSGVTRFARTVENRRGSSARPASVSASARTSQVLALPRHVKSKHDIVVAEHPVTGEGNVWVPVNGRHGGIGSLSSARI